MVDKLKDKDLFPSKNVRIESPTGDLLQINQLGQMEVEVKNSTLDVQFPSAQEVTIENVGAISVDASGSTVPISVAGTISVDASGATIPISHAGDLDVNMTNSSIAITTSETLDVQFPSAQEVTFPSAQGVNIVSGNVGITGTPNVNIASGSVGISGTPNVAVTSGSVGISGTVDIDLTAQSVNLDTTGFDGPRDDQTIINNYTRCQQEDSWKTLYTVTTGKTFYCTDIIITNQDDASTTDIAIGISETKILGIGKLTAGEKANLHFRTPLEFTSTEVIQEFQDSAQTSDTDVTLIGWEE